jgi:hypothetical protein
MADASDKSSVRTPKSKSAKVTYPGGERPKELVTALTELEQKYGIELVNLIGQHGGADDGLGQPMSGKADDYPVRLYAPDKYDDAVAIKRSLMGARTDGQTPFGMATLQAEDMNYIARKRDQMTAAQFKQFVSGMYNKNDPAQAALLHKVYPELIEEQKQIIEDRIDLVKRLAMIKLYGQPRDKEDLRLLFALSSGAIKPPSGNLWEPSSFTASLDNSAEPSIKRGFFSPVKVYVSGISDRKKLPFDQLNAVLGGSPNLSGGTGPRGYTGDLKDGGIPL